MANRVCLGQRTTGEYGLWISKPGQNVLTASAQNLLFSTDMSAFQVMATGAATIAAGATSVTVTLPSYGFRPVILWHSIYAGQVTEVIDLLKYNSSTSVTFSLASALPAKVDVYYGLINESF